MPQKFLVTKKSDVMSSAATAKLLAGLPFTKSTNTSTGGDVAKSTDPHHKTEATVVQTSAEKLDLSIKPKGEIQYVR